MAIDRQIRGDQVPAMLYRSKSDDTHARGHSTARSQDVRAARPDAQHTQNVLHTCARLVKSMHATQTGDLLVNHIRECCTAISSARKEYKIVCTNINMKHFGISVGSCLGELMCVTARMGLEIFAHATASQLTNTNKLYSISMN